MIDLDTMAAAMFGGTTPQAAPNTQAMPTDASMAERMFGTSPTTATTNTDPRAFNTLDDQAKGERLFQTDDPSLYHGDAMRSIESAAMEKFIASPEEAAAASKHWGSTFQSFGLTSTESAEVANIGVQAFTTPASPELVMTWTEQAKEALVRDFGPQGASQALADARAYVGLYASPDLKEVLMSTGLGNHPQLVRMAAAKARALRMAGKL